MKRYVVAVTVALLVAGVVTTASAAPPATWMVVEGTGDPAVDVPAVQAAVDIGGNILLRGTFDFGDLGRVNITTDGVTVVGELDNRGNHLTVIKGGHVPFSIGSSLAAPAVPLDGDPTRVPVGDVTIRDLVFDGPTAVGIGAWASEGTLTIAGNRVHDGVAYSAQWFPGYFLPFGVGIAVSPSTFLSPPQPGLITGQVSIEGNTVDGFGWWGNGILYGPCGAAGLISGNVIGPVGLVGIELADPWGFQSGLGPVEVSRNRIHPGSVGYMGFGIFDKLGGVVIDHNEIVVTNPSADGIGSSPRRPVPSIITANDITIDGDWFGIGLYGGSTGTYVAHNRIAGTGFAAMTAWEVSRPVLSNSFAGNNTSGFSPVAADYLVIRATDTLIVGTGNGTVIDHEGVGTHITGVTLVAGQVGPRMAAANEARLAQLALLRGSGPGSAP